MRATDKESSTMYRIVKNKQKGFTLIELMIVVAIIGILAAVAIPQFLDMMKSSKRNEAELNLDAIKKSEKAGWHERSGFVAGTAGGLPADGTATEGCCGSARADRKCEADQTAVEAWTSDAVWQMLDFRIDQPNYFFMEYDGTDDAFTATATGDLDCDDTVVVYSLEGARDGNGDPMFTLTKPAFVD